jgi:glucosamine 6-phosphate synthetase-like amidotransferase/phosphosugar isomerase protein
MCGILGLTYVESEMLSMAAKGVLVELLLLSKSRDKEDSGFDLHSGKTISKWCSTCTITERLASSVFQKELDKCRNCSKRYFDSIAYSRLVTNGYEPENRTNQHVVSGSAHAVRNGIIVNQEELWPQHPCLVRHTDLDSKSITALVNHLANMDIPADECMPQMCSQVLGMRPRYSL